MVLNDVTELISAVSPPDEVVTTAIADVMDEKRNTIENISYSSKLEAKKEARVSYSASGK